MIILYIKNKLISILFLKYKKFFNNFVYYFIDKTYYKDYNKTVFKFAVERIGNSGVKRKCWRISKTRQMKICEIGWNSGWNRPYAKSA